jgi:type I restriction enzyme S subunit
MKSWDTVTIADFGKVVTGKTPSIEKPEHFGDKYPFVTPSDIYWGNKYSKTERFLSNKGAEALSRILLPPKSVCVVCIASIGKVCSATSLSVSNQQINSIVVDSHRHDPDFVYYLATMLRSTLEAYAGGAATPIVNKGAFSKIKVCVPKRRIQRKIAAILTAYDDLIETNKRRIALLEKMAEELYREWFVRMRFPGYQNTKFVKGVPEGWEVARVDSLGKVVTGKTPSTTVARFYGGEYPFIKTPDMHGNMFVLDTNETLTEDGIRSQPSQTIPKNSLCVSCIGTGGIVSITTKTSQTNQQINSICLKRCEDLEWSYYVLKGQKETIQLFGSTGTTMTNLSKGKFSGINFFSPPKELRNEFHVIVSPIFSQIQTLASSTQILTQTRDLLLPRLISGKLSVEDLDIQLPPSMREEAD